MLMTKKKKIKLLYTTDIHGNVMPLIYGTNEEADIGLAKYATVVKKMKEENEHIILIDNGDLMQGTPLMTHYVKQYQHQANPMIEILNRLKIDAAVLGNHEFNFGNKVLTDAIEQSHFPWLSANIIDASSKKPQFGPPYIVKQIDDEVRVAIVGVTTHYIPNWESPNHIKGLTFLDACETLDDWVKHIREKENPDLLIAAYHGGFERDINTGEPTEKMTGENQAYQMCKQIKGIDILLTGHQHRELVGNIKDVLVIQAGSHGRTYGEINMVLEKEGNVWNVIKKKAAVRTLETVEADDEILQYIGDLEKSTQQWLDEPIGFIDGDMTIIDPFQARIKKHPFIQFIHDVQMEESGVDISVTALLNNHSVGFKETVTMRDVVSNYIYPNTLVVLQLTGKDIKAALEKTASYFTLDNEGKIIVDPSYVRPKPQHYNYDMWEGIEYEINVSKPIGNRIEKLTYQNREIKEHETYHVVLNNYRASGGGDYDMFKDKPVIREIQKDMVEIIREYFERHKYVKAYTKDNYHVVAL